MGAHTSSPPTDDVRALLDAIRRIVQSLHASSRDSQSTTGLSTAQLFVLRTVEGSGGLSINDLAARTFTHQSSVSVVVWGQGGGARVFIPGDRGRVDRADARRRLIALTPVGRRVLQGAPRAAPELLVDAVVAMPASSRRATARALERLADAMAARRRPPMFLESRASA
jgi:DNA-binding MarR family transcriptional regulator